MEISVVVPVLNEEASIGPLYDRIRCALEPLQVRWELLFVDDSSTDGTFRELSRLNEADARVRAVRLSRNFGHQLALTAGMDRATGAAVVTMDGDLQHPPELLPGLIDAWRAGHDVVYTVRRNTKGIGFFKRLTGRMFYRTMRIMTGLELTGMADFRLLDRRVLTTLNSMRERSRFLRGMVRWVGFRQVGIEYVADQRSCGNSKYGVRRMLRLAIDAATSFTRVPLRMAFGMSLICISICILYGLFVLGAALFTDYVVPGWASITLAVLFLGSLQLLTIGLLGEYVGQIHEEVKGRPLYVVRDVLGTPGRPAEAIQPEEIVSFRGLGPGREGQSGSADA